MSDQNKDEQLDNLSGGVETHPVAPILFKPEPPSTHPIYPTDPVGGKKSNPVG
ncbi:MAG TPA: hypothetical protein VKR56_06760 [Candidatus Cybelea sp.]|nr:hypothetical protein [Candidatus Cybelea sp.]